MYELLKEREQTLAVSESDNAVRQGATGSGSRLEALSSMKSSFDIPDSSQPGLEGHGARSGPKDPLSDSVQNSTLVTSIDSSEDIAPSGFNV